MAYETLEIVKRDEGVTWIYIDNEPVNAIGAELMNELENAASELEADDATRVIVIASKHEKIFLAGADLKGLMAGTGPSDDGSDPIAAQSERMQRCFQRFANLRKPVIAAINGHALGGGCELAIACDIRIATEKTKIGLPELNLGIIPSAGGTQRLSRLIGKGRAIDMILTGKILTGEEAERIGLVSESVKAEDLKEAVEEKANQIKSKGPLATRLAKEVIHNGYDTDMQTGLLVEKLAQALLFSTNDKTEGATAFLEKRNPDFKGK